MVDGALTLDHHPVAQLLALLHDALDRALHEVGHDRVDGGAPALDHDARLAGGHERGADPGILGRSTQLQHHRHLANGAIRADRQDDPLARDRGDDRSAVVRGPVGRRTSCERDPVRGRRSGQVRVVREERMEARDDVQAMLDGRQQDALPGSPAADRRSARYR